jgi:hypothetical protein
LRFCPMNSSSLAVLNTSGQNSGISGMLLCAMPRRVLAVVLQVLIEPTDVGDFVRAGPI